VLSEALAVELDQAAAVAGFLFAHRVEHGGGCGKILAQAFGVIGVDALVVFFERDGEREDFAFGQAVEFAHGFRIAFGRGTGVPRRK
jgi:hypothetical protein